MSKKLECRVCGRLYEPCRSLRNTAGGAAFDWREVACSPACGEKYLAAVIASRTPVKAETKTEKAKVKKERIVQQADPATPFASVAKEDPIQDNDQ